MSWTTSRIINSRCQTRFLLQIIMHCSIRLLILAPFLLQFAYAQLCTDTSLLLVPGSSASTAVSGITGSMCSASLTYPNQQGIAFAPFVPASCGNAATIQEISLSNDAPIGAATLTVSCQEGNVVSSTCYLVTVDGITASRRFRRQSSSSNSIRFVCGSASGVQASQSISSVLSGVSPMTDAISGNSVAASAATPTMSTNSGSLAVTSTSSVAQVNPTASSPGTAGATTMTQAIGGSLSASTFSTPTMSASISPPQTMPSNQGSGSTLSPPHPTARSLSSTCPC
jgi:hypothetical protein